MIMKPTPHPIKVLSVGELKAQFSEVLTQIERDGQPIGISYGRNRQTVAAIVPWSLVAHEGERPLGVLQGRARCILSEDFEISDSDLLEA